MANQIPLIVNAGAAQIQELATADNLEISANIVAGGILTDGYYYANGTPVTFGGGSAGNTDWANIGNINNSNGPTTISIGQNAGQGTDSVAIGTQAGSSAQSANSVAIGWQAGYITQGTQSVAIGPGAAQGLQGGNSVAIGWAAGSSSQGNSSVAIGKQAAELNQKDSAVAIGYEAGFDTQGTNSIAIGITSGMTLQGNNSVAIGISAGSNVQGTKAVAIGYSAGELNQGNNSIAIGASAGVGFANPQANNTIILNATGVELDGVDAQTNSFYVAPVRNDTGNITNALYYNTATFEVSYGPAGGAASAAGNAGDIQINVAGNIGADSTLRYVDTGGEMTLYADYMNTSTVFTNDILGSGNAINISAQFGNSVLFDTTGGISATGNVTAADFTTTGSNGDITMTGGNITGANVVGANTVVGNGNLHLQPDPANTGSYLDIFLTSGPDLHLVASAAANLILGKDDGANVMTSWNGNVYIQSWTRDFPTHVGGVWTFGYDGNLTVPGAIRTASNSQLELTESANTAYLGTTADDSTALYLTATTAQLYANGEVSISSNVGGGNAHGWAFDVDGNTNIPGNIISFGNIGITTNVGNTTSSWTFGTDGTTQFPANTINTAGQLSIKSFDSLLDISSANTTVGSGGEILLNSGFTGPSSAGVQLVAYVDGTQAALKTWNFGADGNLHTPQGGYIGPADVKGQGTMLSGGTGNITSVTSYYADAPGIYSSCLTANPDGTLNISTYGNGTGLLGQWIFGDGNLTVLGNFNAATASPAPSINGFDSINAITFSASGNVTANIFNLGNAGNLTYSSIQQNQNPPYGSEAYGIELLTTTDDANVFSSISAGPDYVSLKSTNAGNANVVLQGGYGITLSTSNATGGAIKNWTFTAAGEALYPGNISTSGNVYATNIVAEASFNIQSSNFNAIVGNRYGVDTTSNPVTATLTAFPITGTAVFFADAGGAFATNNFTINPVGRTIMGSSGNYVVNTNNNSFGLFWNGTTWRTYSNV